jgi:A/G-specific adenine glycosylase
MLQQTQVSRVIPKFEAFIASFPTLEDLARTSLDQVLTHWNGLGYNRRAKFLHDSAHMVVDLGEFPMELKELTTLPGVGHNTAAAIRNYAFELATPFVETNIRTVIFHEFYSDVAEMVSDQEVREIVEQTMDTDHPREWFYAMMDYGAMLKATSGGRLPQSKHYKKQSPLRGSIREVRGQIVKTLSEHGHMTATQLRQAINADDRYQSALEGLMRDGLVSQHGDELSLTGTAKAS